MAKKINKTGEGGEGVIGDIAFSNKQAVNLITSTNSLYNEN